VTNPTLVDVTVEVFKFPKNKGFAISWDEEFNADVEDDDDGTESAGASFVVPSMGSVSVTVSWAPGSVTKTRNVCESVTLCHGHHRFSIKMVGQAHVPTPKKQAYKASSVPKSNRVGYKPTLNTKSVFKVASRSRLSAENSSPVVARKKEKKYRIVRKPKAQEEAAVVVARPVAKPPSRRLHLRTGKKAVAKPVLNHREANKAGRGDYCDADWVLKQERMFQKWVNFVLCAPTPTPRNAIAIHECMAAFLQSPAVAGVLKCVDREVAAGRIAIRHDRSLRDDLGLKSTILDALMAYSPDWLSAGLFAIFGVTVTNESVALRLVLNDHVLSSPEVEESYAHPTMPGAHTDGFEAAVKRHAVARFLQLVLLLDHAKASGVQGLNHCLFRREADVVKSSADMLRALTPALKGEGDFVKHLSNLGYTVGEAQTPLDEVRRAPHCQFIWQSRHL
jgi:hypothetical protein